MRLLKIFLIFIASFFLSCNMTYGQDTVKEQDSIRIVEKLNRLDELTKETNKLIEKADKVEKKKENLIYRLKMYIITLTNKDEARKANELLGKAKHRNNTEAVKSENNLNPVTEIDIPSGHDSIRGGWIYRLLHKNDFYLKPYKLIDGKKIYL